MDETVNIRELQDLIASKSNFVNMIRTGMDHRIVGQKHLGLRQQWAFLSLRHFEVGRVAVVYWVDGIAQGSILVGRQLQLHLVTTWRNASYERR